jgi:hypothetical protein
MTVVVAFSLGAGSAEALYREVATHGAENVIALSADTRCEDEDNWRFGFDVIRSLPGVRWEIVCDGRTPMQAGRDDRAIPNNRWPICSMKLKIEPMRAWLAARYSPDDVAMSLGLDWTEEHRIEGRMVKDEWRPGTRELWLPWVTTYPLLDKPLLTKPVLLALWRSRGIEPPRLYATGAPHANCGGACVRAGQAEWRRLLYWNRDRYLEWEAEEELSRDLLGDFSILRDRTGGSSTPVSLRSYRERLEHDPSLFDADDEGACACI